MAWRSGLEFLAGERGRPAVPPPPVGIDDPGVRATLEWFHAFVASDFGDPSVGEAMVGQALASFRTLDDQWSVVTADGGLSAHFEHTIAVTPDGPEVFTLA